MKKLKIKLWRVENIVLMKVLEQDESIRAPKNVEIFEFGGMTLKSKTMPEILSECIYICGSNKEKDNEVALRTYSTTEAAKRAMCSIALLVKEYNKHCETIDEIVSTDESIDCLIVE